MASNHSGPKLILCVLAFLMVVPNLAFATMATEQSTSEVTSSRASSRALEACPSSVTGWTISGTHVYTGTCTISGGAITIQNGADITFENVTLTHTGAYYIWNYNNLRILNSTIIGGASWSGITGWLGMKLTRIENSTVKGSTQYGVYTWGGRAEIGNSTISTSGGYGIEVFTGTGGYITNTVVKNTTNTGIYIFQASKYWVNNNTVTMTSGNFGTYLATFGGVYENNSVKGGTVNALRIDPTVPSSFFHNRAYGSAVGLYLSGANTLNAYYCNFTGNTGNDISLGNNAKLKAYDTSFNTSTMDTTSSVEVYWSANFSVKWLSNGKGVQGATIGITNTTNNKDPRNLLTNSTGVIQKIFLEDYLKVWNAKTDCAPYTFDASITTGGKSYTNSTKGNITNGKNDFLIILDDVPPPLTLASPSDGIVTNQSWTVVKAWTERNIFKDWPVTAIVLLDSTVYNPPVGLDGYIEQNVSLPSDGKHMITVKALDSQLNMKIIMINVTRDTTPPGLTITSPSDGKLTNVTIIDVQGTTEASANLTVNGVVVPVQSTGTFTCSYHLVEGDNIITVRSEDKVHNWNKKVLKVKLDTKPPVLSIAQPVNGYRTNQSTISIQGTTEALATVTINDIVVQLSGTSFQMPYDLKESSNILNVKSCDAAGNCNITSIHVFLKTTIPSLILISPTDGLLTNHATIALQGTTDDGSKVTINGHPITFFGMSFSYNLTLIEGKNILIVDSVDDVGNKAEVIIAVYLDTIAPALTINDPKDGITVNTPEITIDGSTEPNATIILNNLQLSNTNGAFTKKITLIEGLNFINVTAMDAAGNNATASVKVILDTKISLKVNGLTTGVVFVTNLTTYNVTGTTDPDASVYVNNKSITIDINGNFKTAVQLSLGMNNITVKAEDKIGNKISSTYQIQRKEVDQNKPPIIPGKHHDVSNGSMLVPILVIVALAAAFGIGIGLYMRKRGKAKGAQPTKASQMALQNSPETQPDVMQKGPRT